MKLTLAAIFLVRILSDIFKVPEDDEIAPPSYDRLK